MRDELYETYYELRDEAMHEALSDIKAGIETQPWRLVPLGLAQNVWGEFARLGHVRNEKGLERIRSIVVENIVKLDINTECCGHSRSLPLDEMADWDVSEEMLEETDYFFADGNWRISDYAFDRLIPLALDLIGAAPPNELIMSIDEVLSVTHPRSNLASWFIEGGIAGLDALGDY